MAGIPKNAKSEGENLKNSEEAPLPLEKDDRPCEYGVLLSDKIKHYVRRHRIIEPFDEGCLEPAGYKMRIGEIYYHGRNKKFLSDGDLIKIKPYDVVVIETAERVCIPRFMIARWNIKVKLAYEGLLWVGAAQVDPGYVGHLSCPIYNLSTKTVKLKKGDALALIDFVKTTKYDKSTCKDFPNKSPRGIEDVIGEGLESALSKYQDRIDKAEKTADEVKTQSTYFSTVVITLLGVLFAVLMGTRTIAEMPKLVWGEYIGIIAIMLSYGLSLSALFLNLRSEHGAIWKCFLVLMVLMSVLIVFLLGFWVRAVLP